jgi:predicted protein tyrosine phosphatase
VVPFRISVCGIDELAGHCAARVSHVVSILDPDWPVPPAFGAFGEHERLELRFHDVIEARTDTVVPETEHVAALLAFGRDLTPAAHLLVHCHAGVSRSTASLALLIAQAIPGVSADKVFAEVLRIRPVAWPNLRIVELGDALLGRRGTLIAALHEVYRRKIEADPELALVMTAAGRGREVEGTGNMTGWETC